MDFFQGGYFMREDFLLLFLSPVRFAADGKVMETHYTNLSGENTHMTNESALRYLLENELSGKKLSKIFILASKEVRKEIKNFFPVCNLQKKLRTNTRSLLSCTK